jgi:hypothetical protein
MTAESRRTQGTGPAPLPRVMRILQVVQRFSPELGGLETHVSEVTKRLALLGDVEVTVLTTDRTGLLPREEWLNGVRVIRRRSFSKTGEEYFSPGIVRVIRRGGWDSHLPQRRALVERPRTDHLHPEPHQSAAAHESR